MVILFTQLVSYFNQHCLQGQTYSPVFSHHQNSGFYLLSWLHIQKGERMGEHNSKQFRKYFSYGTRHHICWTFYNSSRPYQWLLEDKDTASVFFLFDLFPEVCSFTGSICMACFKHSTTWLIDGRSLGFLTRQLLASLAILRAASREYSLLNLGSMIMVNFLVSTGNCLTQSKSFCSFVGRFLSNECLPVRIS